MGPGRPHSDWDWSKEAGVTHDLGSCNCRPCAQHALGAFEGHGSLNFTQNGVYEHAPLHTRAKRRQQAPRLGKEGPRKTKTFHQLPQMAGMARQAPEGRAVGEVVVGWWQRSGQSSWPSKRAQGFCLTTPWPMQHDSASGQAIHPLPTGQHAPTTALGRMGHYGRGPPVNWPKNWG